MNKANPMTKHIIEKPICAKSIKIIASAAIKIDTAASQRK